MRCEEFREALSARLDGEPPGMTADVLEGHLACCPDCARFESAAAALRRRLAVRSGSGMPAAVLEAARVHHRPQPCRWHPARPEWHRATQWVAAGVAAVAAAVVLPLAPGTQLHLVPSRHPSPCNAGLHSRQASPAGASR